MAAPVARGGPAVFTVAYRLVAVVCWGACADAGCVPGACKVGAYLSRPSRSSFATGVSDSHPCVHIDSGIQDFGGSAVLLTRRRSRRRCSVNCGSPRAWRMVMATPVPQSSLYRDDGQTSYALKVIAVGIKRQKRRIINQAGRPSRAPSAASTKMVRTGRLEPT